ncbi:MAG: alanine--tRNA ligase [Candidatus Dactylopiibacterium carminicum]|uniref:Alanine--tRNA ligase n=1 Tax=Candidatus Dactylopiibacterium carminicum TaxID=857335 RepID=A0A272ERE0_9RHOO|nr:alanine--tRNA ligase [Candidatus Dactylopiibacterium carminicum]KAF7598800.1 alanine--tRNA ligase [Candidatus Dactylopiibacterium carminicum]PAS92673.1 MAG: alanine--tRNA ligase [Candidatus Dactylopiibacterium carminicum]PAS94716.1 MAG: alanine--tRNA ligase [Candidatus Dactylopiibacterium carminicum]PAS98820.1 MAG: alanine--tRNA ligase [Candidatus Dactylopiibacterium carminicum]
MKAADIRSTFLNFFASKGHQIVPSSPVVPGDDPTLLFTNAGMNQFKDVFLGFDKRPYTRATTAQKCIRAGGKHNDLENVGYTARHHTFFEMLGNFSFGDYFKQDAIRYAWELLTEVFKLPKDRLWATVYAEDDEAYEIWTQQIGLPPERVVRIGDNKGARYASDNFWMMGDTGPCGPCSEIFYDFGPSVAGGPPGSPDEDGDRYTEVWNNVFMQFNRRLDENGNYVMDALPKPSVDTGMGLERLARVLQNVPTNYDIDLFVNLMAAARREVEAAGGADIDPDSPSLKAIADHIRACAFTVADGVVPSNEGRGYVLRRIARRAIRHGYKLGARKPFFYKLVAALTEEMGAAYPELVAKQRRVTEVLKQEEERFFQTIAYGMEILEATLVLMTTRGVQVLDGEIAFKLHDTYGFPLDLTADVLRERGLSVDEAGFNAAMARQREQARAAGKFKMAQGLEYSGTPTTFHGYEKLWVEDARVTALYVEGSPVEVVRAGDDAVVVLDNTPFYAESGGQAGDSGFLQNGTARCEVDDTQKIQADVFGHHGRVVEGEIRIGDIIDARVNGVRRAATARNHSVTHLMHKALREVLGNHVQQKGSLVDADKTRFDFAQNAPVTDEQIRKVEEIVNREILTNAATQARVMPIEEAQKTGAMMLFGEKYGDSVRVLDIGSSRELCGGTHVARTGDIGFFKIVMESGVAAGVRRVEAVTGENALRYVLERDAALGVVAAALKAPAGEVPTKLGQTLEHLRALEKELAALKSKLASSQGDALVAQAVEIAGARVLAATLSGADVPALREAVDKLRDKLGSAAVVLAAVNDGKVSLIAGVTANLTGKVKAGDLVNFVAQQIGGKGGGRPDMAQAGGTDAAALPAALAGVKDWVAGKLA